MLDTFFEKVRFYSVTASAQHFSLRMHIPVKLDLRRAIDTNYPIKFEHVDIARFGSEVIHKESDIYGYLYNVFQGYGTEILLQIMRDTMKKLFVEPDKEIQQSTPTARNGLSPRPASGSKRPRDADDALGDDHDGPHHSFQSQPRRKRSIAATESEGEGEVDGSSVGSLRE